MRQPLILILIGQLDTGGAERHLAQICPALQRRGFRLLVCSLTDKGSQAVVLEEGGVRVVAPPIPTIVSKYRPKIPKYIGMLFFLSVTTMWLIGVLLMNRPQVLHCFLPTAYWIGGFLGVFRGGIKVMSRRSMNNYQRGKSYIHSYECWLHRKMNAVLGNSKRVVAQLQKDEKVSEDKLGLIYNGVAIRPMSKSSSGSKIRNETGANLDSIVFIIVANLKPCKGHQDLLNAMSIINEELTLDWRLLIVGRDDGIRESLKTQASLLRVSRNVCFLGARSDVHELFSASDVGILCSHEEGFSNALLEGMAAGLPMVVTDVGGNPEAVIDEKTGLVVPPRDPSKLGEAILRLANDNELRKRMGEAGRKRVEEHFPLDKCVDNYVRLYECLLDGGDVSDVPELQAVIT